MAMQIRLATAGLCAALLLGGAGAWPAAANLDEIDDQEIERKDFVQGGATDSGRADRQARLLYYQSQPALLRYLMSSLEGRIILYRLWLFQQLYWQPKPPAAEPQSAPQPAPQPGPMPEPGDAPSESVLDQLEESGAPLPMVGAPGSGTALKAFDEIGNAEPPPAESILDQIDELPKPAVNQAAPPPVRTKD